MKKSELKQLIKEVLQDNLNEATYDPDISNLASECLSLLAHPNFNKFLEKLDDPQMYDTYYMFYHMLKQYE